ncbi:MAG: hypothetical protein K2Q26_08110 [Bdellovibrionales bacterium]|nr:hypothetical protein [Bdellovibrionales bacterium]
MRNYIYLSIFVTVSLGALFYFFQRTQSRLTVKHEQVLNLLASARQAEATLDKDVLKSRGFFHLNYDPLVASEKSFEDVCSKLKSLENISPELAHALQDPITKYCLAAEAKLAQIERFKSHNAVYRNSIYFIQKLATEDAGRFQLSRRTPTDRLKKVLVRVSLAYSVVSTDDAKKELETLLVRTKEYSSNEDLDIIHTHARRLLTAKAKLDEITSSVLHSPSPQILEEIRVKYFKNYKSAEAFAHFNRRMLLGMCILFLLFILRNIVLLWRAAQKLAEANSDLEHKVHLRTRELEKSNETIIQQQQKMIFSAKISSLGEMAGGIAHEINTPLAVIVMRADQLMDCAQESELHPEEVVRSLEIIRRTTDRIAKIINGLRFFARDGSKCVVQES